MDADDAWYARHLELLVHAFVTYPKAAMLSNALVYRWKEEDEPLSNAQDNADYNYVSFDYIAALGEGAFPIHIGSTMFRRSLIETHYIRFFEHMRLAEDVNFMLRMSRLGESLLSSYVGLVYYQEDTESAMKQTSKTAALTPLYFEGMEGETWSASEQASIKKFLRREYIKKAYQNRKLALHTEELSTKIGAGTQQIGRWNILPYFVVRYMPEFVYSAYRKYR